MAKILITGCGAIGMALAQHLAAQGHEITGLKRQPPADTGTIRFFRADLTRAESLTGLATDFDYVFYILAPDQRELSQYQAIYVTGLTNLQQHFSSAPVKPLWLMVSSTSVYAQTQGEWVDESSPAEPRNPTSALIRQAEHQIHSSNPKNICVRFSGIYGPGREYLLRMAQHAPQIQYAPPSYTNRIHAADCVGVLSFLVAQHLQGQVLDNCYLASDDHPAALWEVISWLGKQLHYPPPVAQTLGEGAEQNKRCRNRRLKALGYQFLYPSYQEGYGELLRKQGISQ